MFSFKVGNVVETKTGGPQMTVREVTTDGVRCVWFVGTELSAGSFKAEALQKLSD